MFPGWQTWLVRSCCVLHSMCCCNSTSLSTDYASDLPGLLAVIEMFSVERPAAPC
jgi:hypothetical protein